MTAYAMTLTRQDGHRSRSAEYDDHKGKAHHCPYYLNRVLERPVQPCDGSYNNA